MYRTAGGRDGKASGSPSSPSSAYSAALSAPEETSAVTLQKESLKPSEETWRCPTESNRTSALQKCQTEIRIHRPNTQAHTHTQAL